MKENWFYLGWITKTMLSLDRTVSDDMLFHVAERMTTEYVNRVLTEVRWW